MRKVTFIVLAFGAFALMACNGKKGDAAQQPVQQVEAPAVDSADIAAVAGEYKSYSGDKSITLNEDMSVTCKNVSQDYYKWALDAKPQDSMGFVTLSRKGLEQDVNDQIQYDLVEGSILIKNETFRKDMKK